MIWIIPALVFAAGCLAVGIWALMREDKAQRKLGETLTKNVELAVAAQMAQTQMNETMGERDTLKLKLATVREDLRICESNRQSLQEKLDEALKPRTRGKAKTSPGTREEL